MRKVTDDDLDADVDLIHRTMTPQSVEDAIEAVAGAEKALAKLRAGKSATLRALEMVRNVLEDSLEE